MFIFVWTLLYMSAAIFVTSYMLHMLAYRNGLISSTGEIDESIRDDFGSDSDFGLSKYSDKDFYFDKEQKSQHPLLHKWINFGGGYYGTVAFVELLLIELKQIKDFIFGWKGLDAFMGEASFSLQFLIDLIVAFFTEQLQNFIQAIIWPTFYLQHFHIVACGVLIFATHWIFKLGRQLSLHVATKQYPSGTKGLGSSFKSQ